MEIIMSDSDYLDGIIFNFEIPKDIPELFVRTISLQAESLALRQFIIKNLSEILGKTDKEIDEEIDSYTEAARKELYAQFAVKRCE